MRVSSKIILGILCGGLMFLSGASFARGQDPNEDARRQAEEQERQARRQQEEQEREARRQQEEQQRRQQREQEEQQRRQQEEQERQQRQQAEEFARQQQQQAEEARRRQDEDQQEAQRRQQQQQAEDEARQRQQQQQQQDEADRQRQQQNNDAPPPAPPAPAPPAPAAPTPVVVAPGVPAAPVILRLPAVGVRPGVRFVPPVANGFNAPNFQIPPPQFAPERRQPARVVEPPATVIWTGKPLNQLLEQVQENADAADGPKINAAVVTHLNVISEGGGGNIGALKNGKIEWPATFSQKAFQARRDKINTLMAALIKQVQKGEADADDLDAAHRQVQDLRADLRDAIRRFSPSEYIRATHFIEDLTAVLDALHQPDATNFFNGKYTPQGKTVAELVQFMKKHHLKFAPAVEADHAAYVAFYKEMSKYSQAAQGQN
jgi:hypothetical protein